MKNVKHPLLEPTPGLRSLLATRYFPGARPNPGPKAAKSGQKWPKVATHDDFSLFTVYRFPGARPKEVPKGAKRCQKVPKSAIRSDPMSFRAKINHQARSRGRQSAHRRKSVKLSKETVKFWSSINHLRQASCLGVWVVPRPFPIRKMAERDPPAPCARTVGAPSIWKVVSHAKNVQNLPALNREDLGVPIRYCQRRV